jgi:chaperonin GroES
VQPGDTVIFSKWSGNEIKMDDEEHLIVREDDVLCVVES